MRAAHGRHRVRRSPRPGAPDRRKPTRLLPIRWRWIHSARSLRRITAGSCPPIGPSDSAPEAVLASGPVPALPSADDVPDRGGAAAAWSAPGVRGARPAAARRALGTESRAGPARRSGGGQVGSSGPPAGPRVRMSPRPVGRRGVRDGAGLRRPPSALRPDARPAGATADRAARRAAGRVRPDPRRPAGSVSRRAGGAEPARGRSRAESGGLSRGRRAVVGPGVRADARVRRAPSPRRAGGARVRGA